MLYEGELVEYFKFIRLQRTQSRREFQITFREIMERRLVETTYNEDDVRDILKELEDTMLSTIENELVHHSHMNVVLLQQYFDQAEHHKIRLKANMPELENRFAVLRCYCFFKVLFINYFH